MSMCSVTLVLLTGSARLCQAARVDINAKILGELDQSQMTKSDRDIQEFVLQVFRDVVQPSNQQALSNACSKFGRFDGRGRLIWSLGKPPENGAKEWDCNDNVDAMSASDHIPWRHVLVENYAYDLYHFIPVKGDDDMDFADYKDKLINAIRPFKDTLFCDVQSYTRRLQRLLYFFEDDSDLLAQVQDYRWMRFYLFPEGYNRRLSINVPTPSRPDFVGCVIQKLLVPKKIDQMKVHMVHAMGAENMSVPTMTSDNVILYLKKDNDMDTAVSEAQGCLDTTVGPFDRPGPHCMKQMGVGSNIYGGADDLDGGMSYGQRIATLFGEGYLRMIKRDSPGAQDPGCLKEVLYAIGKMVGAYKPTKVSHSDRVTEVRFVEGLVGALEKFGLKNGLDGLQGLL